MLLSKRIDGFPYPERFCPYCESQLTVQEAFHNQELPEIFKVVFFCLNPFCGAYDEGAKQCYARVYYSCPEAEQLMYDKRIWLTPKRKN